VIIAALLLACCLSAPTEVTIDSDTVTLGSIIRFPAGDARAALYLGTAPQPGLGRSYIRQELIAKVRTSGLSVDDLQLPETVIVRRKSQGLDPAIVSQLVRDAFAKQFPDADIHIVSFDNPDVDLATGPLEMTASLPDKPDPSAPVFVRLDIRSGAYSRKVFVKTVAEVRKPQPVLRNDIAANSEIHADDIEWKVTPLRGHGEPILAIETLSGMLAKRGIPAGEVITGDLLYSPLLVHKGETVTVKASNGGISITAVMRARASAHLGETISVEHLSGVGSTSARVIGPRLLEASQGTK
jgi:flagella basal body P-ring formation protein FlgA